MPTPTFKRAVLLGGGALFGLLPYCAGAASLQISPVGVRFAAGQLASSIVLQNMGDAPIYGQVRVYRWDQKNGEDVLTPTRDLIVSPPVVQIAANASQGDPPGASGRCGAQRRSQLPGADR